MASLIAFERYVFEIAQMKAFPVHNSAEGFPNTYAEFCFLITQRCGTKLTRTY